MTSGDEIEIGWYVTEDNSRKRIEQNFVIYEVVDNAGMANLAGTKSPALFTDLLTAQDLQLLDGELNTVYYAVDSRYDGEGEIESVIEDLGALLNNSLTAEDVGFSLDYQDSANSLSISTDQGLGRIDGEDVLALRENLSALSQGSTLLEVLQVPIIEMEYQNQQLLTLASRQVSSLEEGNRSLWHFADSGFGHQVAGEGEAWLWQTADNDRINGYALSPTGDYGAVAHSSGIVIASELDLDDDVWADIDSEGEMEDIAAGNSGWWALESNDNGLTLHDYQLDLSNFESQNLSIDLPSTVLSLDLLVDDLLYLEVEGLLSVQRYVSQSLEVNASFDQWQDGDYWPQIATQFVGTHPSCDGIAGLSSITLGTWCSYEQGILQYSDADVVSIRLPILSSAGGFGQLPQLFLAFGGGQSPITVEDDNVAVSNRLSVLEMTPGLSNIWVKGLIPYAFGNDSA